MSLKDLYGPWAVLIGGSEGVGEHLARKLAAGGVNLVLVARKSAPLLETARKARQEGGVEVRTLELDIASPDVLERIRELTDDVEVGFLAHNVGGGGSYGLFTDCTLDAVLKSVWANPVALTKLAHHFGKPMAERGRGGILMIGSISGNAGSYNLATYSGAKAYNQIFMEALWAELEPLGVHVLAFPIGATDTPARARSGTVNADEMPVASSEAVAQQALDQLPHGPVYVAPPYRDYFESMCALPRREAAVTMRDLMTRMLPDQAVEERQGA